MRRTTLLAERASFPRPLVATLSVAEAAAKVIYNAHGHPAPFDPDAGWWLPEALDRVAGALRDPAFQARVDAVVIAPEVRALAAYLEKR